VIRKIGTGDSGEPVVLAELNEHERARFTTVIKAARLQMLDRPGVEVTRALLFLGALDDAFGLGVGASLNAEDDDAVLRDAPDAAKEN